MPQSLNLSTRNLVLALQRAVVQAGAASAPVIVPGRNLIATLALFAGLHVAPAAAAALDGVTLPDTMRYEGRDLHLNGLTLRSYSVFQVNIYVAGLYVETPTHDAASLLMPKGIRVLVFRFVRDVDAEHVRGAWQEGFADNCPKPCAVPAGAIARFLQSVFAVRAGDESMLAFNGSQMTATLNGRPAGSFDDAGMSTLLLACFFGPNRRPSGSSTNYSACIEAPLGTAHAPRRKILGSSLPPAQSLLQG